MVLVTQVNNIKELRLNGWMFSVYLNAVPHIYLYWYIVQQFRTEAPKIIVVFMNVG